MTGIRARVLAVLLVAVLAVMVAIGYAVFAARRSEPARADSPASTPSTPVRAGSAELKSALAEPHVLFRSSSDGLAYGRLGVVPLDDPGADPVIVDMTCDRVYGNGEDTICMWADIGVLTSYHATLLNESMKTEHELPLPGGPSRARVSSDGRWAASTVFVSGHSYAQAGFSTATSIYDVATGESLGNLEEWTFVENGEPYRNVDTNLWGVTFMPNDARFYVTVGTQGRTVLGVGDIASRTITMESIDVECPSLSPDGSRLAFKRKSGAPGNWRIWVRDLDTGAETAIAESTSVDDQVEWLDESTLLYGLQRPGTGQSDVWAAPISGGTPRLLIPDASSPSVVR